MDIFKIIFVFVFISTLMSYASLPQDKREISIKLQKIQLISNNKVGNDWNNYLTVGDEVIKVGQCLIYKPEKRGPLKVIAHAMEIDKLYSDYAESVILIPYSDLISIKKSQLFEINVNVIENGGRYAGNTAKWKFVFEIMQE